MLQQKICSALINANILYMIQIKNANLCSDKCEKIEPYPYRN